MSTTPHNAFDPGKSYSINQIRAYLDVWQRCGRIVSGKVAHDFRVFFMRHKGSIEAKYTTNKGVLPDALIKEMRDAFRRSEEFLD